jgi:hypothetical protein
MDKDDTDGFKEFFGIGIIIAIGSQFVGARRR